MKKILFLLLANTYVLVALAQNTVRYQEDVGVIKKYDNMYPQPKNPILFVGSSSIRLWIDFNQKFGQYGAINRGIGGAVLNDMIYWADELIVHYKPRQIVLYVGENDLPDTTTTADSVLHRTEKLIRKIRAKLPEVPIVYICMKPSPSRDAYGDKAIKGNALVKEFLQRERNATFLDIYTPMLKDGKSRPELFLDDQLHMNEKGYAIWEKELQKHLIKRTK